MIKTFSLLVFATFLLSNVVQAEGQKLKEKLSKGTITITAEIKGCDDDAKKYCPGLKAGSQNLFMCMMAYEEKISKECKLGIQEAAIAMKMGAAALEYSAQACEADADKHCLNVQPGNGQIVACLKKNEAKVSEQCITALKETGLWNMGAKK